MPGYSLPNPLAPSQETNFDNRTDIALTLVPDVNNPVVGDIDIQQGQIYLATGPAAYAQRLKIKMGFFLGEWFLDTREGMPLIQRILVKNPSKANILAIYSKVIRDDPATQSLDKIDMTINGKDRTAEIVFASRMKDGQLFNSTDFGPFLVGGVPQS